MQQKLTLVLLFFSVCLAFASMENIPHWDHEKELELFCASPSELYQKGESIHPLHLAAALGRADVVEYCLDVLGQNVDLIHRGNATPLMFAAEGGQQDMCKYLLEKGANISANRNDHRNTLFFAMKKNEKITLFLLQYCKTLEDVNSVPTSFPSQEKIIRKIALYFPFMLANTYKGLPKAHYRVRNGEVNAVQSLLDTDPCCLAQEDEDGNQPLVYATTNGSSLMVEILLRKGAPLYHLNYENKHALMYVSRILKKIQVTETERKHFKAIEKMLLEPACLLYKMFGKILPHEIRRQIQYCL